MSQPFINVHIFDGKLQGIFKPSKTYSTEEKKEGLALLIEKLTIPAAIAMVKIMFNDNKSDNFQSENNLDASNILMELVQLIDNPDVLNGLNPQQLEDIEAIVVG